MLQPHGMFPRLQSFGNAVVRHQTHLLLQHLTKMSTVMAPIHPSVLDAGGESVSSGELALFLQLLLVPFALHQEAVGLLQ